MADVNQELINVLQKYVGPGQSALRGALSSSHKRRTGKAARSFTGRVMHDGGIPWGIAWNTKRYAFILHNGVRAQIITDKLRNRSYYTKGFQGSSFITQAIDEIIEPLAADVQNTIGDVVISQMKF